MEGSRSGGRSITGLITSGMGALCLVAIAVGGCRRDPRETLPRNVRESVHRDYSYCRGGEIRGYDLGGGRYRVVACELDVVYVCPTGAHSRWQTCQQEGAVQTAGGVVVVSVPGSGPVQSAPAPVQTVAPTPAPASAPTREQIEQGISQWLDTQRTTILQCTQTQAALLDVSWAADGTPTITLGGELHGTPGEQCVATARAGVRFTTGGQAGSMRHVVQ